MKKLVLLSVAAALLSGCATPPIEVATSFKDSGALVLAYVDYTGQPKPTAQALQTRANSICESWGYRSAIRAENKPYETVAGIGASNVQISYQCNK